MKSIHFLISAALIVIAAQPVFASGSLDYYCVSTPNSKNPEQTIRYTYDEGESITAKLFRTKGVDKKEFKKLMKQENPKDLDSGQLDSITKERDVLNASGCILETENLKPADAAEDQKEYEECMKGKNKADVKETDTTETRHDSFENKDIQFDHITQTVTFHDARDPKDDSVLSLDIHDISLTSSNPDYTGTLTIKSKRRAYRSLSAPIKVTCSVSTP